MLDKVAYSAVAYLAAIAGFVDAVGFITLGHIYTANMSGNSVAVGIQIASSQWWEMLRRLWPVAAFIVGMLFCRILIEVAARYHIRFAASIAAACEIGFLLPVCLGSMVPMHAQLRQAVYVGLLAGAMGVQNAAITKVQSATVHTGFVTGVLLHCVEEFAKFLTWLFDRLKNGNHFPNGILKGSLEQRSLQLSMWLAVIWLSYLAGACFGALDENAIHFRALFTPLISLFIVIAVDFRHPLATNEEKSQQNVAS